ncbi:MAG: tyrosine-type recombinase/integrase [Saprospiraceae bacterium]|nr:tyrosine-type recombinase/integrase [Saprospiraceae bacterium]
MFHEPAFFEYLTHERRASGHTLTAYRRDLSLFLTFIAEKYSLTSVDEVRHSHIRAWMVHLMHQGNSARSVNRRLSCLKSYFRYLKRRGLLPRDPMTKVVAPKTGKRLPVFAQASEIQALFLHTDFPDTFTGLRDRVLLELLYATGMRRGELAALTEDDLDFSRNVIRIQGKGNKTRLAPIGPWLPDLLQTYLERRRATHPDAGPLLFLNTRGGPLRGDGVYYVVHKYLSLVTALEQRSPHVLRHSFATHLSNEGAELNAVKELLGHSSLAATQVYLHNSIERLKAVYDKAHPKGGEE